MKILIISFSLIAILFNSSLAQDTSCGILWEPPIQLTDSSYSAYSPKIALSGDDTIHVTWKEDYAKHRLPYARSINGVWEPIRDLIYDTLQFPRRFNENIIAVERNIVYIFSNGESEMKKNVMSKSTNGGTTWITARIGTDSASGLLSANVHQDTVIFVYHPDNGYSYTPPFLIVSVDAGQTWTKRSDTLDGWTRTALTPGTLHLVRDVFIGGAQEKLYMRSFDLGNTWVDKETLSTVDGKFSHEHCIAVNFSLKESHLFVSWRDGTACAGMVGCTIMSRESYNNGNEWNLQVPLTQEPRGYDPDATISDDNKTVVAWTSELLFVSDHVVTRVRKHPDSSWSSIVDHTPISRVGGLQKVAITQKAVHLVWTQSVGEGSNEKFCIFYRRGRFLTTDIKEENKELPQGFYLSQNYPNPFNPKTQLSFVISNSSFVVLKVYDVFGREAANLVNEKKAPGKYEVEWNADGFASGVYFIRLVSGKYISNIKAILMK